MLIARCKRFCKVIKMLAIHNQIHLQMLCGKVANAFAKLSKCQQFTTISFKSFIAITLQTLLQSYQNVSNSQQYQVKHFLQISCKRFCKVIKMLAIHNRDIMRSDKFQVANAFAKLSKCQQFTTIEYNQLFIEMLQTLLQSYQNVSNSQLFYLIIKFMYSCKRFCKVIKMLAIHNDTLTVTDFQVVANAFAKLSKCQQFTTIFCGTENEILLQTLLQSYQNVSNSQPGWVMDCLIKSCKRFCKVIKMLAIHNRQQGIMRLKIVANAFAKLSKCQQFTTKIRKLMIAFELQTLLQSYQNVSNSQPSIKQTKS